MANEAVPSIEELKESVADLGHTAADTINANRKATAESLEKASAAIHEKADQLPGGERVSGFAHKTADRLKNTARYVRKRDANGMMRDFGSGVKTHPVPALVVAAAAGFLAGRAFMRNE
jgi:ElaB/YqjD/DUF883 family membrane-anchored ribosome-binding protein